eukprot:scaffold41315_cov20-Tisochrysis_lutea.AAC.3
MPHTKGNAALGVPNLREVQCAKLRWKRAKGAVRGPAYDFLRHNFLHHNTMPPACFQLKRTGAISIDKDEKQSSLGWKALLA